jgi:hypothetical protein
LRGRIEENMELFSKSSNCSYQQEENLEED